MAIAVLLLLPGCTGAGGSEGSDGDRTQSAPSSSREVVVVSANVHQFEPSVARLRTFTRALAERFAAERTAPDVIFLEEIEQDTVARLSTLLDDVFPGTSYAPTGPLDRHVKAKAIVDTAANQMRGSKRWTDACDSRNEYVALRLAQSNGGAVYSAAGVHIPWDSAMSCRVQNMMLMKRTLAGWEGPLIVAGDFNQRAVEERRECDLRESSDPLPWYAQLTSDAGGPRFVDAVKVAAARRGEAVGAQWTYEGIGPTELCDGTTEFRRNRIDYVFLAGAEVIAAGADSPGWAATDPGTYRCERPATCRYSDHRFVWARISVGP